MSNDASHIAASCKEALDHAWRYFDLHAGQRMAMFNYFLAVFGLASAGLAGCLQMSGLLRLTGVVLGIALIVVAFTFWKLDQRSSFLVKHAEMAISFFENQTLPEPGRLFGAEPEQTGDTRAMAHRITRMWTYGQCFRLIFSLAALVGIIGAVLAAAPWIMGD